MSNSDKAKKNNFPTTTKRFGNTVYIVSSNLKSSSLVQPKQIQETMKHLLLQELDKNEN